MTRKNNADVLSGLVELDGKKVIDIGCGDGTFTRMMTRHGARVVGVECGAAQLEKARRARPAGNESYVEGVAEKLPLPAAAFDVVVFFNSLHHVPVDAQDTALDEALRVLKPGGIAYIAEPLAEGPHFDLMQPVHDETRVRAKAYEAIGRAPGRGFETGEEMLYVHPATHESFEAFCEQMARINPDRADDVDARKADLKAAFARLGTKTGDGFAFDQPMRVNILKKPS